MAKTWSFGKIADRVQRSKFNSLLRILSIIVLAALVFGAYHVYKDIWPTPYKAKQAGFQIVFPGTPTINTLPSQKASGVEESGAIYSIQDQAKGTDYAVFVTSYAHTNFSSLSKSSILTTLDSEIEVLAHNSEANLSNGRTITFEGVTAVGATLKPTNRSESDTNVLAFLHGSRLYIIFGTGISQSKFSSFTKTFHFIN